MGENMIIVGVDGSDESLAAVRWAASAAAAYDGNLHIVMARLAEEDDAFLPLADPISPEALSADREAGDAIVERAARAAREWVADLSIDTELVDGEPVDVLRERGLAAKMIVVGSRCLTGFRAAVLGSTSATLVAVSDVPTVVVRGVPPDDETRDANRRRMSASGAVVAGVDGGTTTDTVLRFAFEHASVTRSELEIVLCAHVTQYVPAPWGGARDSQDRLEARLGELVAGWRADHPDVTVGLRVVAAHATAGLVKASEGKGLLVVGTRRRHAVARTLLGSVSLGVVHHAMCPVAVIPTPPEPTTDPFAD